MHEPFDPSQHLVSPINHKLEKIGKAETGEIRELNETELFVCNMIQIRIAKALGVNTMDWISNPENTKRFRSVFNSLRDEWLNNKPEEWMTLMDRCSFSMRNETESFSELEDLLKRKMEETNA